jgi:hypothetical protein
LVTRHKPLEGTAGTDELLRAAVQVKARSPPSNDQSGQSAQDCHTEIADGLIGDQPANGEFADVSPDTGFFETLGQAVRPARQDRTERAPEQVERLRLGRG